MNGPKVEIDINSYRAGRVAVLRECAPMSLRVGDPVIAWMPEEYDDSPDLVAQGWVDEIWGGLLYVRVNGKDFVEEIKHD